MKEAFKPVWGLFFILIVFVAVAGMIRYFQPDEIVPWRADFEAARQEAGREGKPVFAYFTADWCVPCQQMAATTWTDAQVEAALRNYVPVKIDIERQPELAQQYLVSAIPHFVVLDSLGAPVTSFTGMLRPEDFLAWLERFE